jgi:hypothetical protein
MKCPVCGGQIDGVSSFHCAFSKRHYNVVIDTDSSPFRIIREYVRVNDGKKQYYIIQTQSQTEIYIFQLNGDYEVVLPNKMEPAPKSIKFDKKLFEFSQTNREKLVNKVKTIIVFS